MSRKQQSTSESKDKNSSIEEIRQMLDQKELEYDLWEANLEQAELQLYQCQDKINSLIQDDQPLSKYIEELQSCYEKFNQEVNDLEKRYENNENQGSLDDADKLLSLLRAKVVRIEEKIRILDQDQNTNG